MAFSNRHIDRIMSMFNSSSEGLWLMDVNESTLFFNSTFYDQFDLPEAPELYDWIELIHPDDRKQFTKKVDNHIDKEFQGERIKHEYRVLKKDGAYCWIQALGVMNNDGENYMVGSHKDITHEKDMLSKLHNLAFYDHITGLPNREKFRVDFDILDNNETQTLVVIRAESLHSQFNLYGESFTEQIVKYIVSCFSVFSSYGAICYRASMDIFLIHIPVSVTEADLEEMFNVFIRRCKLVSKIKPQLSGMINTCLGAIQYTSDSRYSTNEIMQWASKTCEYAMYHNQTKWAICNAELKNSIDRFFYMESKLQKAIENDEIVIHLQPIFDAKTKMLSTFEALARWEKSDIGPICPSEFIPTAERKGLISLLGKSVLRQACQFIRSYNKKWNTDVCVNVNVSVLQLFNAQFPDRVIEIVEELGIDPQWIVLELTESVLLDSKHYAIEQLKRLKEYGFKLSMDDFGTGYTSIMGFFRLPFKQIKLDRELVEEAMHNNEVLSYMEFITRLCIDNNVEVTAEGIEAQDMLDKFSKVGVTFLQGFLLSKPLQADTALNFNSWPLDTK